MLCRWIPHPRNWRTNLPESSLCTKRRSKALLMAGWTIIESVLELPSLNGCSQALNETPVAYLPETLAHLWAWTVADKLRPQWDFIQVRINWQILPVYFIFMVHVEESTSRPSSRHTRSYTHPFPSPSNSRSPSPLLQFGLPTLKGSANGRRSTSPQHALSTPYEK